MIYLIRHCQARGQDPNAPLTEIGQQQAIALANCLSKVQIDRIVSSPYLRAYQSIVPLADCLGLSIEVDDRLVERVLSTVSLNNWRDRLAETFADLDLCFEGGESSRMAMNRGIAVVNEAIEGEANSVAIVTHGNLMTLILKYFKESIGFLEWANLQNPDVYCLRVKDGKLGIERMDLLAKLEGERCDRIFFCFF